MHDPGSNQAGKDGTWIIVELNKQQFALPAAEVRELVMMPDAAEVPGSPSHVRGVMNLRGRLMPVVDLRKRLGMTSRKEETESFCALMEQRQQDHINWLAELDASLRQNREFKLATDPRQCAFGRWYYSFEAEDAWIGGLLKRFDEPHQKIHATASEAIGLRQRGDTDSALRLIEEKRNTVLSLMIELFTNLRSLIRETQREIAVVLDTGKNLFGVSVDAAVSLETFTRENIEAVSASGDASIARFAKKANAARPILLLATDPLLTGGAIA
jgi:chemotaxis signal transduction protein